MSLLNEITDREKKIERIKNLSILCALPFMFTFTNLWAGFVLQKLWNWFLTPVFSLNSPGVIMCAGLMYSISYVTNQVDIYVLDRKSDSFKDYWTLTIMGFVRPLLFLIPAWIIHFFV